MRKLLYAVGFKIFGGGLFSWVFFTLLGLFTIFSIYEVLELQRSAGASEARVQADILSQEIQRLKVQMQQRDAELATMRLNSALGTPQDSGGKTIFPDTHERILADHERRMSALELMLLNSPEKALALPLLKQEVDLVRDQNRADAANLQSELARLSSTLQWVLGTVIALLLSLAGMVLTALKKPVTSSV